MIVIAHQELTSSAASITFSDIPQTYTDLVVVFSLRSSQSGFDFDDIAIQLNSDTGTNYSGRFLRTRAGSVGSGTTPSNSITIYGSPAGNATANTFGNGSLYIPNYTSNTSKSISSDGYSENNSTSGVQGGIVAGLYNTTSPITSIKLYSVNAWTLVQYSSATLYGITAGSDGTTTVS